MTKQQINIFWIRRDIRLDDNAGLYHLLKSKKNVLLLFIFDKSILDKLEDKADARVTFIHQQIVELKKNLQSKDSDILIKYGHPIEIWKELILHFSIENVYCNKDYEPYTTKRDDDIKDLLTKSNITFCQFKDHVIFESTEVLKDDGKPYVVFTPYKTKWLKTFNDFYVKSYPTEIYFNHFIQIIIEELPSLNSMGFIKSDTEFPPKNYKPILSQYHELRNFPEKDATSRLGLHLRFGTVSIRKVVQKAMATNDVWLSELIWRDFYFSIMWHFPYSSKASFKPEYDKINWRNNAEEYEAWKEGKTGYPLVDAGMRQLNETGFMHNRVRMVTASFLCKHLLIDWKWGERYFASKLLDFDLASNVGGWQWAAGTGVDAAPYFRIFNPSEQVKKFDKDLKYIKKWVPEFNDPFTYPAPIVNHQFARERCLETYKQALKNN